MICLDVFVCVKDFFQENAPKHTFSGSVCTAIARFASVEYFSITSVHSNMKPKRLCMKNLLSWLFVVPFTLMPVVAAGDDFIVRQLSNDCFQEWQSRDWRLGEDAARAAEIPDYVAAIERICSASAELFAEGYPVSPFIHHSQRAILPFIFSGQHADVRQWLLHAATAN